MTSLPVCNSWVFSSSGLLIQDWLLQPVRPLNLSLNWRSQTTQNSSQLLTSRIPADHCNLEAFFYLFLPSFALIALVCSLSNVISEAKRTVRDNRPCLTKVRASPFSSQVLIYSIHVSISAMLNWWMVLLRYIPLGQQGADGVSTTLLTHSGRNQTDRKFARLPPNVVSVLPYVLTINNAVKLSATFFIMYMGAKWLWKLKSRSKTYGLDETEALGEIKNPPAFLGQKTECVNRNKHVETTVVSIPNRRAQEDLSGMEVEKICPELTIINGEEANNLPSGSKTVVYWDKEDKYHTGQLFYKKNRKYLSSAMLMAIILFCGSSALMLPQLWNYKVQKNDENVATDHWALRNFVGQIFYEYVYTILGCIIPIVFLSSLTLLLIFRVYATYKTARLAKNEGAQSRNHYSVGDVDWPVHDCISEVFTILVVVLFHSTFWIGRSTTNTYQRVACLLHNTDHVSGNKLWLNRSTWMWVELIEHSNVFLLQAYILLLRMWHKDNNVTSKQLTDAGISGTGSSYSYESKVPSVATALGTQGDVSCRQPDLNAEEEKTSENVSPISLTHTFPDVLRENGILPKIPRTNMSEVWSNESTPLPYLSYFRSMEYQNTRNPENMSLNLVTFHSMFSEPKSSTINLKYSPRARHPYHGTKAYPNCTIPPNTPIFSDGRWLRKSSPPPLPALPVYTLSMIGDASVYSSPHGSPNCCEQEQDAESRIMKL